MAVNDITVWLADVDALAPRLDALEAALALLAAQEATTASPAGPPELVRRRRHARIALRCLLVRSGVDAARGTPFVLNEHGRPALPGNEAAFSLSRAGSLTAIAIGPDGPLGIDIEQPRPVHLGTARRALLEAAGAALASDPVPDARSPAAVPAPDFLRAWTRLEAFAKARGDGIGRLLTELGITAAGTRSAAPAQIAERAARLAARSGLRTVSIDLPVPGAAAICARPCDLRSPPICHTLTDADLKLG